MSDRKHSGDEKDDAPFVIESFDEEQNSTVRDEHLSNVSAGQSCQGRPHSQRQSLPSSHTDIASPNAPGNMDIAVPVDSLSPTVRLGNGQSYNSDEENVLHKKDPTSERYRIEDSERRAASKHNKDLCAIDAIDVEPHSGDEIPRLNRQSSITTGVSLFSDVSSLTTATARTPPAPGLRRATNLWIVSPGAFSVEGTVGGTADLHDDDSTVTPHHDGETSSTSRPDPPSAPATAQLLQAEVVDDTAQREQMEELIEMNRALTAQLQALGGAAVLVSSRRSSVGRGLLPIAEAQQVTLLQDNVDNHVQRFVANFPGSGLRTRMRRGREKSLPRGESLKRTCSRPRNRWMSVGLLVVTVVIVIGAVLLKTPSSNNGPLEVDILRLANETSTAIPTSGVMSISPTFAPSRVSSQLPAAKTLSPLPDESIQDVPTLLPVENQRPGEVVSTAHPTNIYILPSTSVVYPTQDPPIVSTMTPTVEPTSLKMVSEVEPITTSVPSQLVTGSPTSISAEAPTTYSEYMPTKTMPTPHPTVRPTIGIRPITSIQELKSAVDLYLSDPKSDSMAAKMYGWPIGTWDVSQVDDFSRLFSIDRNHQIGRFNEDIGDWDVSRATDMSEMFFGARSFDQNLNRWETSGVRDMSRMFSGASRFNGVISSWDTRKVTSMERMFADASSFKGDVSKWSVSSVTVFKGMFNGASSFDSDISKWTINRASELENMFSGASSFHRDLCRWGLSISKKANVDGMFESSSCQDTRAPNLEKSIPGPFCALCSDPTEYPTISPTSAPTTLSPTLSPTLFPTTTKSPTLSPTTAEPSLSPSTNAPTQAPTKKSTSTTPATLTRNVPTSEPSRRDPPNDKFGGIMSSMQPTIPMTNEPTPKPTRKPTNKPTSKPTEVLTDEPTTVPTMSPSQFPTEEPSEAPTTESFNK